MRFRQDVRLGGRDPKGVARQKLIVEEVGTGMEPSTERVPVALLGLLVQTPPLDPAPASWRHEDKLLDMPGRCRHPERTAFELECQNHPGPYMAGSDSRVVAAGSAEF